jgi:8-oxo-dGTP diphosphatase
VPPPLPAPLPRSLPRSARRTAYTLALSTFRRLPAPVRRVVVRTAAPTYAVGAVALIEHEGEVLFLRQPHREGWSLPGGLLDRGETPAQAVEREVREETALRIEAGDALTTGVHPSVRRVDVVFRVLADHRPQVRVGGEARDHAWFRPAEVPSADGATHDILASLRDPGQRRDGRVLPAP